MIEPASYERVVVALDLSPISEKLVGWVTGLKPLGTRSVILVHVVDPADYEHPVSGYDINVLIAEAEEEALRKLEEYAGMLRKIFHDVAVLVRRGSPAQMISEAAVDLKADLIIAGSHGKGWFRSILLGSVSEELARTASKPVLIVKDIIEYTEKEKIIRGKPFALERIVAALDLANPEPCVIRHAASMALLTGAEVYLVSVVRRRTADLRMRLEEHVDAFRKLGVEPHGILLRGPPGRTIVEFAAKTDASLIVLGPSEEASGIMELLRGRTLGIVLRHSPASVLVCREPSLKT